MSELKNHIAHFWAFNNSSVENAKSTLYYLVFMFYLLLIVVSTSDAMILIPSSTVKLPVLGVPLPLWEFYLIVPLLVIMLHFNLLYNLIQHSKKVHCYQQIENDPDGLTVFPLVVNFVLANKKTPNGLFLKFVMWTLVFAFPPVLLCFIQWQFSAYHSASMTTWHFFSIILDALVLMFTWHKIFTPTLRNEESNEENESSEEQTDKGAKVTKARLGQLRMIFKAMKVSWWSVAFVGFAFFNLVILLIFKNTDGHSVKRLMPHLNVSNQVLIKAEPSDQIIQRFIALGKSKEEAYCEYARGIDLSKRDLRFCNFSGAYLVNVNLTKADLRGADFSSADLHGGNLTEAKIEEANFHYPKMHYVTLAKVNWRKATHKGADLRNAILKELDWSKLKLENYNFEGATFEKVNLENADLQRLPFTGAIFKDCFLKGVKLNKAELYGVTFSENNSMDGANLTEVQLQGSNLNGVSLNGVDLSKATLEGVVWQQDTVQGVNLRNANLQGALLEIPSFTGNFLAGISIKGLEARATEGQGNYYYGIDSISTGSLRKLEQKFQKYNTNGHLDIHIKSIKEIVEERVIAAKKRMDKTDTTTVREYFGTSNGDAFIKARQQAACQNVYVAEGILSQNPFNTQKENEQKRQELVDYLRNNCPLIYEKIVKRGVVKVN
ncbi:hypothetical protein BKI52_32735 [marine bacterium AO1-C]|nr:hypothetical protein BKI52_32735 [marine bacterium AO1-C]